jgi:hypothetical protein
VVSLPEMKKKKEEERGGRRERMRRRRRKRESRMTRRGRGRGREEKREEEKAKENTKAFDDMIQLIQIGFSGEEGHTVTNLSKHTASRPHIHTFTVLRITNLYTQTQTPDIQTGRQNKQTSRERAKVDKGTRPVVPERGTTAWRHNPCISIQDVPNNGRNRNHKVSKHHFWSLKDFQV